ncbi:MAG: helicase-related protein [Candidatus Izemoplasmatales bacterium]|jgi:competence protein ComFA|nr:helicase-related protein [Candidatus Izemoplasmatales bacterium]
MIETLVKPLNKPYCTVMGIINDKCQRCGAIIDSHDFDGFGRLYCRECLAYGKIADTTIIYRCERKITVKNHKIIMPFVLSEKQKEASCFVDDCLTQRQTGFLHAVCGAGKTEMLYLGLFNAMKKNERICIAIPRRAIVIEMAFRLMEVFPTSVIKPLHEYAKNDDDADVVVSTIHQLMRYYHEFDVIILDETDAFPFRGDAFLHRLIAKALKPNGVFFQMSATIDQELAKMIHRKTIKTFTISARYHRQPLDVPKIYNVMEMKTMIFGNHILPEIINMWLNRHLSEKNQVLIFIPTIKYGKLLAMIMQTKGFSTAFVSSESTDTTDVINRFRLRKVNFLVTTTILERGVTFSNVAVAVISADHRIFDLDTLVQICGRVGRDREFPHGEIAYFCEELTIAIQRSIKYIKKMNQRGNKEGLLDNEMPNMR